MKLTRDRRFQFGITVVGALVAMRVAAAFIVLDPADLTDDKFMPASRAHLLGTDALGRDVGLRIVEAVESFFFPGLFAVLIGVLLGTAAGAVIGYWEKSPVAALVNYLLTIIASVPRLVLIVILLAIMVTSARNPAELNNIRLYFLGAVVGIAYAPQIAEAVAQKVRYFQQEDFVEAARAHGLGHTRILGYHILWANCLPIVVRQACYLYGYFILIETSLSYLGDYGVPEPRPSWGNILSYLRHQIFGGGVLHFDRIGGALYVRSGDLQVPFSDPGWLIQWFSVMAPIIAVTLAIVASILGVVMLGDAVGSNWAKARS